MNQAEQLYLDTKHHYWNALHGGQRQEFNSYEKAAEQAEAAIELYRSLSIPIPADLLDMAENSIAFLRNCYDQHLLVFFSFDCDQRIRKIHAHKEELGIPCFY